MIKRKKFPTRGIKVDGIPPLIQNSTTLNGLIEAFRDSKTSAFFKDYSNLDGTVTWVNQAFADLMGQTREQLVGQDDQDINPRRLARQYRRDDRRVMEFGEF